MAVWQCPAPPSADARQSHRRIFAARGAQPGDGALPGGRHIKYNNEYLQLYNTLTYIFTCMYTVINKQMNIIVYIYIYVQYKHEHVIK